MSRAREQAKQDRAREKRPAVPADPAAVGPVPGQLAIPLAPETATDEQGRPVTVLAEPAALATTTDISTGTDR